MKIEENDAIGQEKMISELVKSGLLAFDYNGGNGGLRIWLTEKFEELKFKEGRERLIELLERANKNKSHENYRHR